MTNSSVHLTHLICEIVKATTKVSLHPLKLRHGGLKGHTTSCGGRRSGKRWNSRSYRISRLHSWPLRSKLGLASPDKTNADGTHDGKERKERNGNVKVLKDPRDSRRKDELIMSGGILIHIYDRGDELRGKDNGVRVNVITMLRNLGPFAKLEHGVFSLPHHMEGVP